MIFVTKKERKMAVLSALQKKNAPVSLNELMESLGPVFAERTVRRWLNEMVTEGLVIKTGHKSGTRYEPTSPPARQSFFNAPALKAIDYVRQPIFQRAPVVYNKQWLYEYRPNQTFYLSIHDREKMRAQGQRGVDKNSAGTYARKIYNRLLIDLSYNSSRLEGNTYSLLDTERLIFEGASAEGKLDAEKVMILNHKEAIRHLVDAAARIKIDFNEIGTLHFLLSDGLAPAQYSGKIRDHGVRIGASTYIPLESKIELERHLQILCQKAAEIQDPFETSFFLLIHVAYLQAFVDVNKRTSRLSANIPLVQHNQVPLSFNDVDKEDYNSAMISIYELNDVEPLARLYYYSYLRNCQRYDADAEAIGYDEVRVRFRQMRRRIIRHIIVNQLISTALDDYMQEQIAAIPEDHRQRFLATVKEDLQEISLQRIAGLGITAQQLKDWLAIRDKP